MEHWGCRSPKPRQSTESGLAGGEWGKTLTSDNAVMPVERGLCAMAAIRCLAVNTRDAG